MSEPVLNLFEQQAANRRRSQWLVAGFVLFFAWVGFGGDLAFYLLTKDAPPEAWHHDFPFIGVVVTLIGVAFCSFAVKNGAKRVLWAAGAWEVVEPATPEQRQLVNVVEEMSIAAGVPRPKVWVVPDPDPNAFATGAGPSEAHIAVTEGLLERLNREELQAVVAHEMAHIRNLDVMLMTRLAAMVGALALISDGMGRYMRGGGRLSFAGKGGSGGKGGRGGLGLVVLVIWIVTLIMAPFISRLLAMCVSRKREYLADATGAQFTRNPMALATALEKIESVATPTRAITRGSAHLCIVDPAQRRLSSREGFLADFLESHPPIRLRIARLRGMAYQNAKIPGNSSPVAVGQA